MGIFELALHIRLFLDPKIEKMNLATNLLRYFLITLNTVFMLFATGMFVTAIMGEVYYRDYFDVVSGQAVLEGLLGTSCFIFVIAMLGWSGAYKQHNGLLKVYLALCILVFATQLLASVFALAYTDRMQPYFAASMASVIDSYAVSNATQTGFDFIQADFGCCGVWNTSDWTQSATWMSQVNSTLANNTDLEVEDPSQPIVPDSCCTDPFEFCGIILNDANSTFQTGCAVALHEDIVAHVNVFAIVLVVICTLQLSAILFGGCLVANADEADEEQQTLIENEQTTTDQQS